MSLSGTIRKVIKEAHLKKILNEGDKVWEPKNGGSPFGMRVHPITGVKKLHGGQDYGEPKGTAIIVINPGKVLRSDFGNANGNFIEILHDDGTVTMYLHLEKRLVNKGDYVSAGKVIGTVGSTGLSTGPHLHFVYKKSQTSSAENPRNFAPKYFKFSNTTTPDVSNIVKPVEKGKTKDYLQYLFNSGKVYNPTKVRISSVGTLKSKKGNENIYGIKRKSDDRVFLFVFNNDFEVSYIEMSLEDFKTKKESKINGTWEKLTETSVVRDSKSKNQEKSSETKNKETQKSGDLKDDRLSEPILKAINDLIKKGVNITKKNIDKEFEQEGSTRPDLGKNKVAEKKILELINDCNKKFGISGGLVSGYRSYEDQVKNFANKVLKDKRTIDDVQSANTLPGFSQHHTGRAFDIYSTDTKWWDGKPNVKKWVADNASKYGFEITYKTKGPLRIAEPWHLYYIG